MSEDRTARKKIEALERRVAELEEARNEQCRINDELYVKKDAPAVSELNKACESFYKGDGWKPEAEAVECQACKDMLFPPKVCPDKPFPTEKTKCEHEWFYQKIDGKVYCQHCGTLFVADCEGPQGEPVKEQTLENIVANWIKDRNGCDWNYIANGVIEIIRSHSSDKVAIDRKVAENFMSEDYTSYDLEALRKALEA